MELYWSPEPELMVEVTNEKGVDKAQCYYHALDVEKLEARVKELEQENELVTEQNTTMNASLLKLEAELAQVKDIIREVASSGVSYDAGKYVEVQIDIDTWNSILNEKEAHND